MSNHKENKNKFHKKEKKNIQQLSSYYSMQLLYYLDCS